MSSTTSVQQLASDPALPCAAMPQTPGWVTRHPVPAHWRALPPPSTFADAVLASLAKLDRRSRRGTAGDGRSSAALSDDDDWCGAWAIATSVPALRSQFCATTPLGRSQDRSHSGPEGVTLAVPRPTSVGADAVMANDRLGGRRKALEPGILSAAIDPRRACLPVDCELQPIVPGGDAVDTAGTKGVVRAVAIPGPTPPAVPRKSSAISSTLRSQQGLGYYCICRCQRRPGGSYRPPNR